MVATSIDQLVQNVEEAYWSVPTETTDFIFLSYMKSLEGSLTVGGGNHYPLAHMGKYKLLRAGQLPKSVRCSDEAMEAALEMLQ